MKPCRISMINNNMRQVFHTQAFEYQKQPAVLTAAINRKAGSDSHLPRFFSFSSENGAPASSRAGLAVKPAREDAGAPPDFHCFRALSRKIGAVISSVNLRCDRPFSEWRIPSSGTGKSLAPACHLRASASRPRLIVGSRVRISMVVFATKWSVPSGSACSLLPSRTADRLARGRSRT